MRPANSTNDDIIADLCRRLDELVLEYEGELDAKDVSGVLLSRVLQLQTMDPETGKGLMKWMWEQFDLIEQANPGGMI